jgi:transposase-like protein
MSLVTTNPPATQNGRVNEEQEPQAPVKPKRRQFSAAYKLAIVNEYDHLTDAGDKGALLRREGLYSSHIVEWRKARDAGALGALETKTRRSSKTPEQRELEVLRAKNARLEKKLARAETALELAGKAHALLEMLSESAESNNEGSKK